MREVKFRAWDKNGKEMYFGSPVYQYSGTKNGELEYLCEYITGSHLSKISLDQEGGYDFEVMQYTGLKDKNGKEIYEGDIYNAYIYDGIADKPTHIFRKIEVKWFDEMAGFGISPISQQQIKDGWRIEYEVIGSIYENPELLK